MELLMCDTIAKTSMHGRLAAAFTPFALSWFPFVFLFAHFISFVHSFRFHCTRFCALSAVKTRVKFNCFVFYEIRILCCNFWLQINCCTVFIRCSQKRSQNALHFGIEDKHTHTQSLASTTNEKQFFFARR